MGVCFNAFLAKGALPLIVCVWNKTFDKIVKPVYYLNYIIYFASRYLRHEKYFLQKEIRCWKMKVEKKNLKTPVIAACGAGALIAGTATVGAYALLNGAVTIDMVADSVAKLAFGLSVPVMTKIFTEHYQDAVRTY